MSEFKKRDQELYEHWKSTGSKESLGQLVNQLSPLIYSEVQRASGTLPTAALSAEAKRWTVHAIQNYDPTRGASLSTHVVGYLPKIRRLNYKYQNMVRLPENQHLKFSEYSNAIQNLKDALNRDPSDDELAKELGWSKGAVVKYKGSLYSDLTESGNERPSEFAQYNSSAVFMEHLRQELSREELFILDHLNDMKASDIASRLNIDINRLNYLKRKMIDKIHRFKSQMGEA